MSTARRSSSSLGRYELEEIIGRGGVAEVWRARFGDDRFAKTVVVKRVLPELREQSELHDAFVREARLAQQLHHGNIVQVLDLGDDEGVPYIVLEHVDGCSLQTLLEQAGTLPVDVALHVAEQIASALQYAHSAEDEHGAPLGLVHRDVTPGNVLLAKDGVVKLGDFGIARVHALGNDTMPGFIKGTPIYLAPEQAAGRPVDARADVYALGLVLRRMLVGDGELVGIDPELATIVLLATEPAVKDRLPSAAALLARLQTYRGAHGVASGGDALAERVRAAIGKPRRRALAIDAGLRASDTPATRQLARASAPRRSVWPLVAAMLLAMVGVAIVWGPGEPKPTVASAQLRDLSVPPPAASPVKPSPPPVDPQPSASAVPPSAPALVADKPARKKTMGRLSVLNLMPWAEVTVDGTRWGIAPVDKALATGRHEVTLYNPAMSAPSRRTVVIEPGGTTEIKAWPR